MATLPYIQLYVSDYLADTQHLTAEEHGSYLLLIMNYWQTEKPIPQNRLQGITRMFNDRWDSVQQNISEFFIEDETGAWYHERIQQDLEKVKSKSKQASEAGKKSAEKRAENREQSKGSSTTVQQKSNDRSTIEEEREKKKEKREKNIEILKEPKKNSLSEQIAIKLQEVSNVINTQAFNEWLDYKKYKTIAPITKTINFLNKYDFATQQQIVDASIMNNYKGLFEPKNTKQQQPYNTPKMQQLNPDINIWDELEKMPQRKIGLQDG